MTLHATPPSPIPPWNTLIREDIETVLRNDPAARNTFEVLTSYPGLHALWIHRIAHSLWTRGSTTTARMLSNINRSLTGVEIHPGARLGRRVFIDHGMGVVIGETTIVGDDCMIYKGVVLGGTSLEPTKRHPTLGRHVVVGSNACILGAVTVGDQAKIGSGSVVIRNVPNRATAVGVPGRIVATRETRYPLDHAALPDPLSTVMRSLTSQIEALAARIEELERSNQPNNDLSSSDTPDIQHLSAIFFEEFEDS